MQIPLQTSNGAVSIAPFVLIDLHTEEGITGSANLFCVTPIALKPVAEFVANLEPTLKGNAISPLELNRKLQGQLRLLGVKGLVGMALAGIDMAAWDALSKAQGLPLAKMLGGELRPIPAYNSCGLGMIGAERAAVEAEQLVNAGFSAIKVRLGYPDLKTDLAVVRAIKSATGPDIQLMSDYNQVLTVAEARKRIQVLDDEGLYWIEEPVLAEDYAGYAQLRRSTRTSLQIGENWWGTHDMMKCLDAGCTDYGMPDVMRIGGVTGWLRAAALAESAGLPLSSHLFPEISAHLLAVSPTCHWLEYVDWANPILQEPVKIEQGHAIPSATPGCGMAWNEANVERYLEGVMN